MVRQPRLSARRSGGCSGLLTLSKREGFRRHGGRTDRGHAEGHTQIGRLNSETYFGHGSVLFSAPFVEPGTHLSIGTISQAVNTFLGKSDGRDKLCATVQV